jgi:cell wall-associated NlpC family hydrolase
MRRIRLILLLIVVSSAFAAALMWPVAGKADQSDPAPSPQPPLPSTDAASGIPLVGTRELQALTKRPKRRITRRLQSVPLGERIVDYAKKYAGVRYVYGGSSPRYGFDCSGFVRYVYQHFGVSLAHSSFADAVTGRRVGRTWLKPGDLLLFDGNGHVGIYIGHGKFIHAPHTGTVVRIETMAGWYSERFDGARRVVHSRWG